MTASIELVYHGIHKNSHFVSLASATRTEATAVRRHIELKAKANAQNPKDTPIQAPASDCGFVGDIPKRENGRYNDNADCKSGGPEPSLKAACFKHHINWLFAFRSPRRTMRQGSPRQYRLCVPEKYPSSWQQM